MLARASTLVSAMRCRQLRLTSLEARPGAARIAASSARVPLSASATTPACGTRRLSSRASMSMRTRAGGGDGLDQGHHAGPAHVGHFEAGADADQDVAVRPQAEGGVGRDAKLMILGEDAAAATKGRHWGGELFGQLTHGGAGVLPTAAGHDQRPARRPTQLDPRHYLPCPRTR